MSSIIITNFTDPVCVWCWATEPVFRALETRYPGEVEIRYVAGGMVPDIYDFEDADNHIDSRNPDPNAQVMHHWLESQPRHLMPIRPEGFSLFSEQTPGSWPQNIAYKAAQIASPKQAGKYLRLLRLATMARAQMTGLRSVQTALAKEAGVDLPAFARALDDGSAKEAFHTDLGLLAGVGVEVFPTFLVKSSQARQARMRGFNTREDFERVFAQLTDGAMQPLPSPPDTQVLDWLLHEHGPLSREEIVQAFDFRDREEADRWMQGLFQSGAYQKEAVGATFLLERTAQ